VTISIGVAERDPERRTCSAVIEAADKALYRSKQRGRNRLTLAGAART
jgi:diguanylate cyclase (GGDEF)-like protein